MIVRTDYTAGFLRIIIFNTNVTKRNYQVQKINNVCSNGQFMVLTFKGINPPPPRDLRPPNNFNRMIKLLLPQ